MVEVGVGDQITPVGQLNSYCLLTLGMKTSMQLSRLQCCIPVGS
jgi:hypothetical protein